MSKQMPFKWKMNGLVDFPVDKFQIRQILKTNSKWILWNVVKPHPFLSTYTPIEFSLAIKNELQVDECNVVLMYELALI